MSSPIQRVIAVLAILSLSGCLGMNDPTGGAYAVGKYIDHDAFKVVEVRREASQWTIIAASTNTRSVAKVRSTYLLKERPPEKINGPHLDFEVLPTGSLSIRVPAALVDQYDAIVIFGQYVEPAKVVDSAREVGAEATLYLSRIRESGGKP